MAGRAGQAVNVWKLLEWMEIAGMAGNGWIVWNSCKWLEMA